MAFIKGSGSYLPEGKITNKILSHYLHLDENWIFERTGIRERRKTKKGESVARIAFIASKIAIENAGIDAESVEGIIFATVTPEFNTPSSACVLQSMLGVKNGFAFDISAACSGFLYGIYIADTLIESRKLNTCLVVGAETLTKFVDYEDKNTSILFGDGAGAVILGSSGHKIIDVFISSDPRGWNTLLIPAGGSRLPPSEYTVRKKLHTIKMKGREVFRNAVLKMEEAIVTLLKRNSLQVHDIALFLPHQANERITRALCERLGVDNTKVFSNIKNIGNTSSASIPLALHEIEKKGILKEGDLMVMTSFGAGYTYGACIVRW